MVIDTERNWIGKTNLKRIVSEVRPEGWSFRVGFCSESAHATEVLDNAHDERYFDGKPTNRDPEECIGAQRCNVTTGYFAREVGAREVGIKDS